MKQKLWRGILCSLFAALTTIQFATASPAALTPTIATVEATPEFWKFWDASLGKSDDERVRLFLDVVVKAHPELYGASVLNNSALVGNPDVSNSYTDASAKIVATYLHAVEPYIPRMRIISNVIHRDFQTYANDFTRTFPGYHPTSTVYFMVSLFNFDGGTRPVGKQTALLFGIDGIARYHSPDENLKVLFDHELFHQYHDQIAPELTDDDAPIWVQLWEEGLATYISQQMNNGSSEAQVLMSPDLAERTRVQMPKIATELLDNADSVDKKEYAKFFFGSSQPTEYPPRCGYYVGYLIAQQIGKGKTLQQLAEMRGPALKAAVTDELKKLTGQTADQK